MLSLPGLLCILRLSHQKLVVEKYLGLGLHRKQTLERIMGSKNKLLKIYNGQVVTASHVIKNATVLVRAGIIEAVVEGNPELSGANEINAKGKYIAPGLIDLQVNGFSGVDFSDQDLTIEELQKATKVLWKVGVTTFLPTVITNDQKSLKKSFSILAGALDDEEIGMSRCTS
jgi:N-acetylglucosamine-6-phosphate deacetylase